MRLTTQVVRSSGALYPWPPHVTGINIDAKGVLNPKDNPKIDFDYEQGYQVSTDSGGRNRTVTVRSFATGGAPPYGKAVNRFRASAQSGKGTAQQEGDITQHNTPILSINDIMTPAPDNPSDQAVVGTPAMRTYRAGPAGPPRADSPPQSVHWQRNKKQWHAN